MRGWSAAVVVAIGLAAAACRSASVAGGASSSPKPASGSEAIAAQPSEGPRTPVPESEPEPVGAADDQPVAWWTPVTPISKEQLSDTDPSAVRTCVEEHRVQADDVTADELFAAAKCLAGHRAFGHEVRIYMHLLQQFPGEGHADEVLVTVGHRYEQLDVRQRAVDAYRQYLAKYPKHEDARVLAQRAVCLARSLGDTATVEQILADLTRLYGRKGGFVAPPEVALAQLCHGLPPVKP